ncbi:SDR family oxidoreductase [Kordiimonas sediminis]|uniref:SDR family oxidoreductase n=1 Tax=Kordiimonas sediminis TaxID=1735581 RepID=A0A919ASQ2_9PROT|nr:SDR family NAD(P)-dependent oxidoreductase [Kordiimonas sediminis]GHF20217.1 SDR family oxidoreductase [Kordiimonas sediminis]
MDAVAIIGGGGAIGAALVTEISAQFPNCTVWSFQRKAPEKTPAGVRFETIDVCDERSVQQAAGTITKPLDLILVTTGILHNDTVHPEKSLKDLNVDQMAQVFAVNTVGPALILKHFSPKLHRDRRAIFAALSARVGSIGDNRLGGWYSYRMSKAGLNMFLKTASIELGRGRKESIVVGLHPGTVDSALSKPFQKGVREGQLKTPDSTAQQLLSVLQRLDSADTGYVFDYKGIKIDY